jgi:hypothetical protein
MPEVPIPDASQIYAPIPSGKKPKYIESYRRGYKAGYRKGYFEGYTIAFKRFRGVGKPRVTSSQDRNQPISNGLPPNDTYYEILEIDENIYQSKIKRAYQSKMTLLGKNKSTIQDDIDLVKKAYSVLSDPKKRKKYDADLKAARAFEEPTAGPGSTESGEEEDENAEEPSNEEINNTTEENGENNENNENNENIEEEDAS